MKHEFEVGDILIQIGHHVVIRILEVRPCDYKYTVLTSISDDELVDEFEEIDGDYVKVDHEA